LGVSLARTVGYRSGGDTTLDHPFVSVVCHAGVDASSISIKCQDVLKAREEKVVEVCPWLLAIRGPGVRYIYLDLWKAQYHEILAYMDVPGDDESHH